MPEKENKRNRETELIALGKIVRYQGNKGHVRIKPLTEYPERFFGLEDVILQTDKVESRRDIEAVREHGGFIVLKLSGVDDIESAESLKGGYLCLPENELPELPDDEYYIYKIKGFTVKTEEDRQLGKLEEVMTGSGSDVFLVRSEEGEEYMIPAAKEIIISIEDKNEEITIKPIPGLLEL